MINTTKHKYISQILKEWKLGVILYKVYYSPKNFLLRLFRKGIINTAVDHRAQQQMEQAAYKLKVVDNHDSADSPLEIHFLTGRKFWYQTIFCAYSFAQHTNIPIRPIIYDDGSLDSKYQEEILRIFPEAKIILNAEIEEYINEHLPEHKFPYLRERRRLQPHMKKITDIRVGSPGWKLVLDSDMLFFRTPEFLIDWLKSPQNPCYMVDVLNSYGYSNTLMTSLTQAEIPDRLNVGICGLNSDDIDWEQLEYWSKTMIDREGTTYYMDQALSAMLMSGKTCSIAPSDEYIAMPSREEGMQPHAIMHHYVDKSKPLYFRYGWKNVLKNS